MVDEANTIVQNSVTLQDMQTLSMTNTWDNEKDKAWDEL